MSSGITKRDFIASVVGATASLAWSPKLFASRSGARWDLIVVGGGTAGLPAAIFAARRGAKVLIVEAGSVLGGTLFLSTGQMSAAGTQLQRSKGIDDSPQEHYDDVMRISEGTADPEMVRLAVENAADTFDWLMDRGFVPLPGHPVKGFGHEPYSKDRYYWAEQKGQAILAVLNQELKPELKRGRVSVLLNTKAKELVQAPDGTVTGLVTVDQEDRVSHHLAQNLLLACGGYAYNPQMMEELEGHTKYGITSWPLSLGTGITLGTDAGGYVRNAELYLPSFGNVLANDVFPSARVASLNHHPERRQPWEIYVNVNGKRFVREDIPSVHAREMALLKQPGHRYWIILDDAILEAATPILRGWTRDELRSAFRNGKSMFYRADSLGKLGDKAGINSEELSITVAGYNVGRVAEKDELGRIHMPLPIDRPPFYAIRVQGDGVTSTGGLAVDRNLSVVRPDGSPIPNLYAAGELLGHGTFSGQSRCGGMSVTPALTFGRLLGQRLLNFAS